MESDVQRFHWIMMIILLLVGVGGIAIVWQTEEIQRQICDAKCWGTLKGNGEG